MLLLIGLEKEEGLVEVVKMEWPDGKRKIGERW